MTVDPQPFSRRRFLKIAAAGYLAGAAGPAWPPARQRWSGTALGAQAEITLSGGTPERVQAALADVRDTLRRMERLFSLYDPDSTLSRLNRAGRADATPAEFIDLLRRAGRLHDISGGLFDPTVQPLWRLRAGTGGKPTSAALARARDLVGWDKVRLGARSVAFERPGMAITLNGIGQGYATDRVAEVLAAHGFAATLVNVGEFRAGAGSWNLGIAGPQGRLIETRRLRHAAIATSSPLALTFQGSGHGHILDPRVDEAATTWSSVSVEAADATRADALSTALALADERLAQRLVDGREVRRILLVDHAGARTVI